MPDQDAMASTQEACADLAPEGGFGSGGGAPGGGADMAEYTSCLEENGVTVPEPGQGRGQGAPPEDGSADRAGTPPVDGGSPMGLDTSDPTVAAGRRGLRIASARAPVRTGRRCPGHHRPACLTLTRSSPDPQEPPTFVEEGGAMAGPTLLLVDDEDNLRSMLEAALRHHGFDVHPVAQRP